MKHVSNKSPHLPTGYYTPREGSESALHPRSKTVGYSGRCGDKNPRIVFWGTPEFSVPALSEVLNAGMEVVAVVTNPPRPVGRAQILSPTPVKEFALNHGIKIFQPETLRDPEFVRMLRDLDSDLFLVAAYGKIIPDEILGIPRHGALNIHPSLLPKYRGASPIESAILAGEKETGVTIMLMDKEMDHGPILTQARLRIEDRDTGQTLSKRLAKLGAECAKNAIPAWLQGSLEPAPQDHAFATYTKILKKEDGKLTWDKTAEELERQIRAYLRWPESHCFWQRDRDALRLKIEAARAIPSTRVNPPGTVWRAEGTPMAVETAKGALAVDRLCPAGGKSMTAEEFIRGHPDIIGAVLL
ncbi:MAG: methionyl-tRNA formyltransferase, partial [Candidatus Sungbacteria bacterium]|nr:methionyl-tRNA formyltransferase [Candidatus Sungbacteria bacterium]